MGWPRRRRQQQQQLRRRAAKDYLLACCSAAIDMCGGGTALLAPVVSAKTAASQTYPTKATYRPSEQTSKWSAAVSPRKQQQQHAPLTGRRRHTGLREKLYSVDSLAETEPEDDDDDDEDETESESGEPSPMRHCAVPTTSTTVVAMATTTLQIEAAIPEETTAKLLLENDEDEDDLVETDDEDADRYSSSSSSVSVSVAPAVMSATSQEEKEEEEEEEEEEKPSDQQTAELSKIVSSSPLETRSDIVNGEDTESEDEMTLDVIISNCSVIIEEVPVVSSQSATPIADVAVETADVCSVDLFGQTLAAEPEPKMAAETAAEPVHAPFLFPAPYFPGDVDEYESDIYETLLRREKAHHVESDYFGFQPHVTPVMRSMLLDWVVEVHNHFNLQPDTLYLTVNYIDRFLATVPVKRENFQLVALTALLIASKFEEVHPVDIEDLVYICERSYTAQQIVQFERQMLAALKFNLVVPTCSGFLEYYTDKLHANLVEAQLANFICEQTLLDFHLSAKYVPSVVASSALLLAKCSVAKRKPELEWVLEFEETTGYYAKDVWCCVHDLSDMLASLPFDLVAVRTKYRSSRFGRVADLPHVNVSAMAIE